MKLKALVLSLSLLSSIAHADCMTAYTDKMTTMNITADIFAFAGLALSTGGATGAGTLATTSSSTTAAKSDNLEKTLRIISQAHLGSGDELVGFNRDLEYFFGGRTIDLRDTAEVILRGDKENVFCADRVYGYEDLKLYAVKQLAAQN